MKKSEINKLIKHRHQLLENEYNDPEVDVLTNQIKNELRINFKKLPIEFILETYTHLGSAPNLIYDDNGRFAVSDDGEQPVVIDDELIDGVVSVFVKPEQWFRTIREAMWYYITVYNS